jgi:hypothetical protein
MSDIAVTVELPGTTWEHLQKTARQQRISVSDVVRDLVLRQTSDMPALPPDAEEELAAFANLSDGVLWLLARTTLSSEEQNELALLNEEAQRRPLTQAEVDRQERLIDSYDRVLVRRAQAASLLKSRGYDLSDPVVLRQNHPL